MSMTRHVFLALGVVITSCAIQEPPPSHTQITLMVVPADFRTAYGTDARRDNGTVELPDSTLAVTVNTFAIGDLDASFLEAIREAIWLVRLDTGQRVPGEVRDGFLTPAGDPVTTPLSWRGGLGFSFVPSAPLAEGWYVFVLESGPLAVGRSLNVSGGYQEMGRFDDLTISRFHVGSRPIWSTLSFVCQDFVEGEAPGCTLGTWWSEPIDLPSDATFDIVADGEPVECTQSMYANGANVECPYHADGTEFTISLTSSVITGADGRTNPHIVVADWRTYSGDRPLDPSFGVAAARASR